MSLSARLNATRGVSSPEMARHDPGPRPSESVDSYLRETRVIAAVALLALVGGVVSDGLAAHFWSRHALLAGLAKSVIVVMLSVGLINEALERRSRRRWSVLAQYVMLEFVLNARLIWTGTMELARLMPSDAITTMSLDAGRRAQQWDDAAVLRTRDELQLELDGRDDPLDRAKQQVWSGGPELVATLALPEGHRVGQRQATGLDRSQHVAARAAIRPVGAIDECPPPGSRIRANSAALL